MEVLSMAEARRSVTFTALIFVGMAIAIGGLIIIVLGLGGSTRFELKVGEVEVATTSVGLAVLTVGAIMSAVIALKLPEGVQVFGATNPTMIERFASFAPLLWI